MSRRDLSPAQAESQNSAEAVVADGRAQVRSFAGKAGTVFRRSGAFLVVGLIGFGIDAGTYNLLVFWGGQGVLHHVPLLAKIIAIAVATVVTYFGNKWWTFAHKRTDNAAREYLLYAIFNVIAIALQLSCLGFSRYVLDLSTPVADNISGTLIGQVVAVLFRYWAYDTFVFTGRRTANAAE